MLNGMTPQEMHAFRTTGTKVAHALHEQQRLDVCIHMFPEVLYKAEQFRGIHILVVPAMSHIPRIVWAAFLCRALLFVHADHSMLASLHTSRLKPEQIRVWRDHAGLMELLCDTPWGFAYHALQPILAHNRKVFLDDEMFQPHTAIAAALSQPTP